MKQRESNLELLRIVSMLFIIMHHYAVHGFLLKENFNLFPIVINKLIILFLSVGGEIGVNCFIFISSFYLINSKIKLNKVIDIFIKVTFYSIAIVLILYLMRDDYLIKLGNLVIIKEIIKAGLSFLIGYWFISCYILLYLSSPFLNKVISNITKIELRVLIVGMLIIWCFFRTSGINLFYSNYIWFVLLYFLSTYIKKYISLEKIKQKFLLIWICTTYFILISSILILGKVLENKILFSKILLHQIAPYNIFIIIISLFLFLYFLKLKIGEVNKINYLATSMLGVYLLHDNILVRKYIWSNVYKNFEFLNSNYLFLHAFFSIVTVFFICIIIDKILDHILKKYILKHVYNILEKTKVYIFKVIERLMLILEKYEK